ncbi:hypothetical protein D3X11_00855 [Streptococcus sp. X16XC17]|uniref:polysaccharide deacetylase family protein n=1 Tax=unclassified Streptococcus TaxID=2608887 RepID=UPI00066FEFEB|nr:MULTISPECIES: polysaccharide deacetylase family protein [unclassified Streptococcus]TCD46061.1 hypothetical protein D3X11_00855 [Streptococcus sp. X16XC17]
MNKKRNSLIVLNLVLVVLIACASWFAYRAYEKRNLSDFIASRQKAFKAETSDLQVGSVGHTYVSAYFPKDQVGKRVSAVEQALYHCIEEKIGQEKPTGSIRKLLFVSTKDEGTHFAKVRKTNIESASYQVRGLSIKEIGKASEDSLLLTEDNQIFTLATFAANQETMRSVFSKQIKTDLMAKETSEEKIHQALEIFKQTQLEELTFSYEASQLTVQLPEAIGLATITVPISSLFEAVKSQYLAEEDLKAYDAYQAEKEAKKREKMIALTFDDGPSATTTPQVLALLKKYNAKATFFVLGQAIAGKESILKQMQADGHEIANHSWSHSNLTRLSADQIKQEIQQTQSAVEAVTGQRPTLLRPPYGAVNKAVMAATQMPAIYWSVDTLDWKSHNPQAILAQVKAGTHKGSIILMHDIHQTTVNSLDSVLSYLSSQGYTFGTVSDLLGDNLNPENIYYDQTSNGPAQ